MYRLLPVLGLCALLGLLVGCQAPAPAPVVVPLVPLYRPSYPYPVIVPVRPVCPGPHCPRCPKPHHEVGKRPRPKRPHRPLLPRPRPRPRPKCCATYGEPEPMVDLLALPTRTRNISSKGAGCCVFRSIDYASRLQNVPALHGMPEWMVQSGIVGGGYPSKVDELIPKIAQARGVPAPAYVQYEGRESLPVIELALRTGRATSITWGGNHMLSCVYLDGSQAAIVDNNSPDKVQWFSRAEFQKRHQAGGSGGGWVVVLLAAAPPPPPRGNGPRPAQSLNCDCPASCGCGCQQGKPCVCTAPACNLPRGADPVHGVAWTAPTTERWTLCGRDVSAAEGVKALEDDSRLPHLTVIGTEAERTAVLTALAGVVGACRTQAYDPTDWAVTCGFVVGGKPTVYLQRADGTVLLRQDGVIAPAAFVSALRKADPSYDPKLDPTGTPTILPAWTDGLVERVKANPMLSLLGLGGAVGAGWLLLRKKDPPATPPAPVGGTLDDLALQLGRQIVRDRLTTPTAPR
jgi:hypothetical protein